MKCEEVGRTNPAAALAALTAPASVRVGRFEVREITLGLMAILDSIDSPFLRPGAPASLPRFAESLFAMTRPSAETRRLLARGREAFSAAAAEWADGVSVREGTDLLLAASAAVRRLSDANPAADGTGEDGTGEDGEARGPDPTAGGPTAG